MQAGSYSVKWCDGQVGIFHDAFLVFTSDPLRIGRRVTSPNGLHELGVSVDELYYRHARMIELTGLVLFVDVAKFGVPAIEDAIKGLSIGRVIIDAKGLSRKQQHDLVFSIIDDVRRTAPRYLFQLYIE